jgi:hypothetical protein
MRFSCGDLIGRVCSALCTGVLMVNCPKKHLPLRHEGTKGRRAKVETGKTAHNPYCETNTIPPSNANGRKMEIERDLCKGDAPGIERRETS